MYFKIVVLLILPFSMAQEDTNEMDTMDTKGVSKNDRMGKCEGTCFTPSECTARGGMANGNCASTFGVCCTCKYFLDIIKLPLASTYVEFSYGR